MALLTNINGKFSVSDAGAVTFNNAFTFPTADGTANYVLKTNGSGQLSWAADSDSGTVKGTFIGVIFLGVVVNGMTLMNINEYWQYVVKGFLILGAVLLNVVQEKKKMNSVADVKMDSNIKVATPTV